jgi:hypothetical protein
MLLLRSCIHDIGKQIAVGNSASMAKDGTVAERFVAEHCNATFLSLWAMPNPVGEDFGKELCDYLVVCDPDIVIISVKDIRLSENPNKVAADRWRREAIERSAKSVYGAERLLKRLTEVQSRAGRVTRLPSPDKRRVHRICVAFGGEGNTSIPSGNFSKGFVHVLDEVSFPILLRELDTIRDLLDYLEAKRSFLESGRNVVFPGEEDFLALYLFNGRSFPDRPDVMILDDTLWPGLLSEGSYRARREADRASYAWDNLIEYVAKDLIKGDLLFADPNGEDESILRVMAQERRFERRCLSETMTEVFTSKKIRARIIQSYSGVVYVFVAFPRDENRMYRRAELMGRCLVARSQFKDEACTVIGIATERANDGKKGLSFDLLMVDIREWTSEFEVKAEQARHELGFFRSPTVIRRHWDEYPPAS